MTMLSLSSFLFAEEKELFNIPNDIQIITCSDVSTNETCENSNDEFVKKGEWSLGFSVGLGARTNPLVDGDNIPLILLPSFSYYGDHFFIDNLDIGYTLFESKSWTLNILTTPAYDRVFFHDWDVGNILVDIGVSGSPTNNPDMGFADQEDQVTQITAFDLKDRKMSWMAGIEVSTDLAASQLQLSLLKEITDNHGGKEIRLAYATDIPSTSWTTAIGLTWKDQYMTDYYYGVDDSEIVDDRGAYQTSSSLSPFFRLNWLSKEKGESFWRFNIEYQRLDKTISNSPIVDNSSVTTIFFGKTFRF